jgi:predicted amidophosphoribosyltransferase
MCASDAVARNSTSFNRARGFARYQDSLVRAKVLLKFEEMEPLADVVRENRKALEADVIVPVPLPKIRRRERGFNQAEM